MNKYLKYIFLTLSVIIILVLVGKVYAQNASDSSTTVREKVQEKVENILKNPKAYIGTITDISEATIQINKFVFDPANEKAGEILQISTNSQTVFTDAKKVTKTIKLSDLAIGDFIIALGFKNSNTVLETKKVLVINTLTPTTRVSLMGTITKADKGSIEVKTLKGDRLLTIKSSKNLKVTIMKNNKLQTLLFSDLSENDVVIIVGVQGESTFDARRIHVIPQDNTMTSPSPKALPKATAKASPTT